MIDNKVEEIKKHVEAIVNILGIEKTESNENTPLRVAKMYVHELFQNRNNSNIEQLNSQMKVFSSEGNHNRVIVEVPFSSMCEHHWMPFMGDATVMYDPEDNIVGLSKIPRVVKFFSKKPQLQERLTNEIGEYLVNLIHPRFLFVRVVAEHTCVSVRGIESPCLTTTVYEYGGEKV
jgi:GTP cyclohydrolase I